MKRLTFFIVIICLLTLSACEQSSSSHTTPVRTPPQSRPKTADNIRPSDTPTHPRTVVKDSTGKVSPAKTKINQTADSDPTTLFNKFLAGKISAYDKNNVSININLFLEDATEDLSVLYAFYDMNGDLIPELIIKTRRGLTIFAIKDEKIVTWREDTSYAMPLNNTAILSERNGAAPPHTDYIYTVVGYQGKDLFKMNFSEYPAFESQGKHYDAVYYINGTQVTKELYDALAAPLLNIGYDLIPWQTLNRK